MAWYWQQSLGDEKVNYYGKVEERYDYLYLIREKHLLDIERTDQEVTTYTVIKG